MSPVKAVRRDQQFPNRLRLTAGFVAGVILPFLCAADGHRTGLTIEERVATQKAIEQVYWNHRTWPKENTTPKPSLSAVLSDAAIRARVEDTLRKSNALEKDWHRPITAEQLQAELNRMAARTHDPAMLRELFAALGNDPHLVAETLARQALVDRLIRTWYANDERFHGDLKKKAEAALATCQRVECMPSMGGEYGETTWKVEAPEAGKAGGESHRDVIRLDGKDWKGQIERLAERLGGRPESLPVLKLSGLEETAEAFIVTAALSQGKDEIRTATVTWPKLSFDMWWQTGRETLTAQVEDTAKQFALPALESSGCVADTWAPTWAEVGPGSGRTNHSAVWTGTEMIVWGGYTGSGWLNTGGRYDPATDSWTGTSTGANVPTPRENHTAVWTGTEMIVWGGCQGSYSPCTSTGGRYDPATDTWTATSIGAHVPAPRGRHTAVWTGTEMIVWGGYNLSSNSGTGGRYNPFTDTWTVTSTGANVPSARYFHTAVWTGTKMIIWGGFNLLGTIESLNTGGCYDPSTDTWTPTSTGANVPAKRLNHTAIWTGTEMIVWGGGSYGYLNTGGRYNPATNNWTATSTSANVPTPREGPTAVWTGMEMIVWGGHDGSGSLNTGGRYHPATNTWTPTSTGANVPAGSSYYHTAIWTGTEMIVWGGSFNYRLLNTGGRYDPSTDTWVPTSVKGDVPAGRYDHTSVWTGSEMIVWGGHDGNSFSNNPGTGGRYDPATDNWIPTSSFGPFARYGHTAVWTGMEMIVWGGSSGASTLSDGGRYDPSKDTWTAIQSAPEASFFATAVWTGTEMIVWGGLPLSAGARYNPATNSWTSTSTGANVPTPRENHIAIWTGTEMIVWGGEDGSGSLSTGGRYDPSTDTWTPTSTGANVPAGRQDHTAIWTGTEMIVWGGNNDESCYVDCCDVDCADFCSFCNTVSLNTGGRYDPSTDTWTPTSTEANVPAERYRHTAVWNGTEMIVWGGNNGVYLNTGGRYDPSTDAWTPTSTAANVPTPREGHSAVWTGTEMIVWGGFPYLADTGGLYCGCPDGTLYYRDADGDGYGDPAVVGTSCDGTIPAGYLANRGDCNDANASVHPGVPELCNGRDDDCDGVIDDGFDVDGDGFPVCAGDCNDGNAAVHPGALELCDGLDNDCNGIVDGFVTVCGVGQCFRTGSCIAGVNSCVPGSPSLEVCDGIDNNCDGDMDNVPIPIGSPSVTIVLTAPPLEWTALSGATGYDVVAGDIATLLSSGGDFYSAIRACLADDLGLNALDLSDSPAVGTGFFYLVRGENCSGAGTYDSGDPSQIRSSDAAINASPLSCPTCGDGICSGNENYDTCPYDCWY